MTSLKRITRIAFDYKIEVLAKKVMDFIETKFNELLDKDIKQLSQLNDTTNNKLFEIMADNYRKVNIELTQYKNMEKGVTQPKCTGDCWDTDDWSGCYGHCRQ